MAPIFVKRYGGGEKKKSYKDMFGFTINQNESDPSHMIAYIADNKDYAPVCMNLEKNTFDYGDWTVENGAWFMGVKPCMLNYDGTVAYYLDPNDYAKKVDGTSSDISDPSFPGNAMVEIPKVYWKIENLGGGIANVYFSDRKLDSGFVCWSHIDNNGNEIPYCYMSCYNCYIDGTRLRSLSGPAEKSLCFKKKAIDEVNYAKANNLTSDTIWYTGVFCDRMLINLLSLLIGKSTNIQKTFGCGKFATYGTSSNGVISSGYSNEKGLFYGGYFDGSKGTEFRGLKLFGIENYYGNLNHRIAGWINDKGVQKVKMTYGQSDGSTVDGYNLDGNGYIPVLDSTSLATGYKKWFIKSCAFTPYGIIPIPGELSAQSDSEKYYCNCMHYDSNALGYAFVGGWSRGGYDANMLYADLGVTDTYSHWSVNADLSCKPLN